MKTTISFKRFAATMLMSLCGMFTITSCQDDAIEPKNNNADVTRSGEQKLKEAYGLSFENFVTENDVKILNADTTEISINKALAEKLGITSFKYHPIGIWDKKSHLPYARKAMEEKIVGDRFILKVKPATVAEMIGAKAEGTFKSDLSGISGDFKASIDMSAKAEAGVKLKILGYEVAEWSNNFDLVGPWTLWKFPVDGSIHKSPLAQKADEARALIDKACSSTEASQARIELVDMMAQMQGKTHDEAETKLAEIMTKQTESTANEQQKLQKMADFIKAQRDELKPKYTQWIKEKNWNEIAAMILANKDVIENRAKNGSFYNSEKALETAHERFVKAHNREPEQNNSDLEELMKTTINYREGIYDDAVRMVLQDSQVKQLIAAEETWTKVHMEDLRDIFQKGFSNKKQADEQYVSRLKSALLKDFRTKFSHLPWEK